MKTKKKMKNLMQTGQEEGVSWWQEKDGYLYYWDETVNEWIVMEGEEEEDPDKCAPCDPTEGAHQKQDDAKSKEQIDTSRDSKESQGSHSSFETPGSKAQANASN